MIYITGDTHIPIDIHKLNGRLFPAQKKMTKQDYVIICGDFGGVWDDSNEEKYWRKWLQDKNFTTLFVDGNHENFDLLHTAFPVVDFCDGKAHQIADSIFHLMRGEVYTIDGRTFFTMGGAQSHDRIYRKVGISWWCDELPSESEYAHADANLARHDHTVDYIITHCAPTSIQWQINPSYAIDHLTAYLDQVRAKVTYKGWYFGHYHENLQVEGKHFALYDEIICLENE